MTPFVYGFGILSNMKPTFWEKAMMFAGVFTCYNSLFISKSDNSRAVELGINAFAAGILFVAVIAFYTFQYTIHQDLAGNILSGKLVLKLGEQYELYSIYFPPAEKFWFSTAARLQDVSGFRSDYVVLGMTYCAILFSSSFAYFIRKKTVGATPWFFITSLIALVVLPILFKNLFGLREHMVALGLWPYLVYRVSDPTGTIIDRKWRIVLGCWIGLTLLFKYFYALAIFLVELADALIQRRASIVFRIENLVSATIVVGYLFIWLILNPENLSTISMMKNAIGANIITPKLNAYYIGLSLFSAVPLLITGAIYKIKNRHLAICFALLVASILVASIQGRWYSHHHFPVILASIFTFWIIGRKTPQIIVTCISFLLINPIYKELTKLTSVQSKIASLEESLENNSAKFDSKRVALLSAHPSPFNEIIAKQGGDRWTALMNMSYITSELKEADIKENNGIVAAPIESFSQGREILHDKTMSLWEDFPPDVIIMDQSTNWPLEHLKINWTHLFSNNDRFLKIMKNYKLSYSHKEHRLAYDYYVRKQ